MELRRILWNLATTLWIPYSVMNHQTSTLLGYFVLSSQTVHFRTSSNIINSPKMRVLYLNTHTSRKMLTQAPTLNLGRQVISIFNRQINNNTSCLCKRYLRILRSKCLIEREKLIRWLINHLIIRCRLRKTYICRQWKSWQWRIKGSLRWSWRSRTDLIQWWRIQFILYLQRRSSIHFQCHRQLFQQPINNHNSHNLLRSSNRRLSIMKELWRRWKSKLLVKSKKSLRSNRWNNFSALTITKNW